MATQLKKYLSEHCLNESLQSAYKSCHSTETTWLRVKNALNFAIDVHTVHQQVPSALKPIVKAGQSGKLTGNEKAKTEVLSKYKDCFEGVGCFEGEYHVTLDATVPPVVHPPRRIPFALLDCLQQELDTLETQSIIAKVN